MEEEYEKKYHQLENAHWWFIGRRAAIKQFLRDVSKDAKILDIGCSSGATISELKKTGYKNVYGADISKKAIEECKKNGLDRVYVRDASSLDFKDRFDVVIASDILEHIKEDKKTVKSWNKIMAPNGKIICFVPAFNYLWSIHDEVNEHYRRYTKKQLKMIFEEAGFSIKKISYWNFFLFLPVFLLRKISSSSDKKDKKDNLQSSYPFFNNLLVNTLKFENFLLRFINFPFGVSAFIIAEKRL